MLHGLQAFYNVTRAQKSRFTSQHSVVDKDQVDRLSYTGGFSKVLNPASLRQHAEVFISPPEHHLIHSTSGGEAWPWVVRNLPSDSPVQPGVRITAGKARHLLYLEDPLPSNRLSNSVTSFLDQSSLSEP